MNHRTAGELGRDFAILAGLAMAFAFFGLQAPIWLAEREIRLAEIEERREAAAVRQAAKILKEKIKALEFRDIVDYYSIFPPDEIALHGSDAFFVSDMEAFAVADEIPEPIRIDWFESVLCDKKPHDGFTNYEYWREAVSTGTTISGQRPRKPQEVLEAANGFPVHRKMPKEYTGEPQPLKYPNFDADCILRSHMIMNIGDYSVKALVKRSKPVKVRGEVTG